MCEGVGVVCVQHRAGIMGIAAGVEKNQPKTEWGCELRSVGTRGNFRLWSVVTQQSLDTAWERDCAWNMEQLLQLQLLSSQFTS